MNVETRNISVNLESRDGVSTPEKAIQKKILSSKVYQAKITKNSLLHLAEGQSKEIQYPPVSANSPLNEWNPDPFETIGENEEEASKRMSPSDIERAYDYPNAPRKPLTKETARATVAGVAGHTLSSIINEITREVRKRGDITQITDSNAKLEPYEKAIIEKVASPHVTLYKNLRLIDIPYLALDIWEDLRNEYVFFKRHGRSNKALLEGNMFGADEVRDWWFSDKQKSFEAKIASAYEKRFREKMIVGASEPDYLTLNIESDPEISNMYTEKPYRNKISWPAFSIQAQAQVDYLLTNDVDGEASYLIIDNKYGKEDVLSPINLAQSLLYSFLVKSQKYNQGEFNNISPRNVLFLYQVFDLHADVPYSYYVDATVYPDRMQEISDVLSVAATNWWFYNKDLVEMKKQDKSAVIMPYLPKPRDEGVAAQPRLF